MPFYLFCNNNRHSTTILFIIIVVLIDSSALLIVSLILFGVLCSSLSVPRSPYSIHHLFPSPSVAPALRLFYRVPPAATGIVSTPLVRLSLW